MSLTAVAHFSQPPCSRYDPAYGARPLKRAIQREVETVLAKKIIAGDVVPGDVIVADVKNERLVIAAGSDPAVVSQSDIATS